MDIHSFFIFSLQEPLRELFHAKFDLLLPAADGGKIRRDGVERLIALAVVGGIFSGLEIFKHNLIARLRVRDRILPRDINLVLRRLPDSLHCLGVSAERCQHSRHRFRVFLNEEAALPVSNILRRAASAHEDASKPAGRRLAHDKAVRVKRRREQEQVCPAVPRADNVPVVGRCGKEHAVRQTELFAVGDDLVAVAAVSDKDHPERRRG